MFYGGIKLTYMDARNFISFCTGVAYPALSTCVVHLNTVHWVHHVVAHAAEYSVDILGSEH